MQHRSYVSQPVRSSNTPSITTRTAGIKDDLTRVFNTAIVSSQKGVKRNFSVELSEVAESVSFKAILNAVRQLSSAQGITERQAAEQIIQAFRAVDDIWKDYVFQEGIERIRKPRS
jgi:hypothetical protein